MRMKRIFVFFISTLIGSLSLLGQEETDTATVQDATGIEKSTYGLRLGVDLSKPIRTLIDDDYTGIEIAGDFRLTKKIYAAAELGTESTTLDFPSFSISSTGGYLKAGINYNLYTNWYGENNLIYVGPRIGYSLFDQTLESFTISTSPDTLFDPDNRTDPVAFDGLSAVWLEVQLGIQFEVINNVFIGVNFQIQNRFTESAPDEFQNVFIPGFGEPTDGSNFSIGFGYRVSYFLPVFKK